jgi:hypothetical protein
LTGGARTGDPDAALRAPFTPRPWPRLLLPALCAATAAALASAPRAWASDGPPPSIDDVEQSLEHDPSYKVRVDAAIVLGKLGQPRSLPTLVGALKDPHPSVRASAAYALGRYASPLAREAVTAALHDPVGVVRQMARDSLRRMAVAEESSTGERGGGIRKHAAPRPSFEVKAVGDPDHRAGPALRSHMHDFLVDQLRPYGDVDPLENQGTYAVDGVIKSLSVSTGGHQVEISCAVQLVVSRQPSGGVFLMSNGEATVQRSRHLYRPENRAGMELQALEAAVRGASEDLVAHLTRP